MAAETRETPPETPPLWLTHHDDMLHRIVTFVDRWEPVLERAEKFFANPVASYLGSKHRPKVPNGRPPVQ